MLSRNCWAGADGEGGPAAERGETAIGGRIPINPSGGLESKGHPIGATGLGQVFELVTQLRGEAGARQVQGARIALAENGGGLAGVEEAVACLTLLGKLSHGVRTSPDMSARPENILANLIANRADELPDFDVLTFEGGGVRPDEVRSYRALWDNARRMAQVLLDQGVKPGERFALLMANHPEFVEAMIAASIVGAAVVPIDPRTRGDKLHFMLASTKCSGVLAADYTLAQLQPLRRRCPRCAGCWASPPTRAVARWPTSPA